MSAAITFGFDSRARRYRQPYVDIPRPLYKELSARWVERREWGQSGKTAWLPASRSLDFISDRIYLLPKRDTTDMALRRSLLSANLLLGLLNRDLEPAQKDPVLDIATRVGSVRKGYGFEARLTPATMPAGSLALLAAERMRDVQAATHLGSAAVTDGGVKATVSWANGIMLQVVPGVEARTDGACQPGQAVDIQAEHVPRLPEQMALVCGLIALAHGEDLATEVSI